MSVHLQTQTVCVDTNANSAKVRPHQHTKKLQRSLSENDKELSKIIAESRKIQYGSGYISLRRCSKDQRFIVKDIIDEAEAESKRMNQIRLQYLESSDVDSSSETEESESSRTSSSSDTDENESLSTSSSSETEESESSRTSSSSDTDENGHGGRFL